MMICRKRYRFLLQKTKKEKKKGEQNQCCLTGSRSCSIVVTHVSLHPKTSFPLLLSDLVNLLLFINAELARTTVDQKQKTSNNGQDLEKIVFGEILVGVVLVKLKKMGQYI